MDPSRQAKCDEMDGRKAYRQLHDLKDLISWNAGVGLQGDWDRVKQELKCAAGNELNKKPEIGDALEWNLKVAEQKTLMAKLKTTEGWVVNTKQIDEKRTEAIVWLRRKYPKIQKEVNNGTHASCNSSSKKRKASPAAAEVRTPSKKRKAASKPAADTRLAQNSQLGITEDTGEAVEAVEEAEEQTAKAVAEPAGSRTGTPDVTHAESSNSTLLASGRDGTLQKTDGEGCRGLGKVGLKPAREVSFQEFQQVSAAMAKSIFEGRFLLEHARGVWQQSTMKERGEFIAVHFGRFASYEKTAMDKPLQVLSEVEDKLVAVEQVTRSATEGKLVGNPRFNEAIRILSARLQAVTATANQLSPRLVG
ncbi:hypothetical protein LTR85_010387 [Meristemomyces frigidus]|nr:hypothetical protein LTR85_010387 [Meristemomyces frigidus]